MTRYFFHLVLGDVEVPDNKGREFSCTEDAFFHARRIIHEAGPYLNEDNDRWLIRVRTVENDFKLDVLFPVQRSTFKAAAG